MELLEAAATWLFDEHDVERIDATVHPDNLRSLRLLESCGFEFEGLDRNTLWNRHGRVDDHRYSLTPQLQEEWQNRPRHRPDTVELVEPYPTGLRHVLALRTHKTQEAFVAPIAVSLAQVAVPPYEEGFDGNAGDPRTVPWPRIVHADGEPVGFVMCEAPTEADPEPYLWRLLIDRLHQRRGIGKRVIELVFDQARAWGASSITVSWVPGVGSPEPLYRAFGFEPTGEIDDGEIVARARLT
jgi:RimJ/RimL family protein N-acetyltransferase